MELQSAYSVSSPIDQCFWSRAGEESLVTYEEVMDEISRCIPLEHIAQEAGVTETAIERTQLDRSDKSYLRPPPNWRPVIARLAWERSGVLIALAQELDEQADSA